MNKDFLLENEHLQITKSDIEIVTKEEKERLKNLPKMYASDPRLLGNLMSITATKLNNLKNSFDKPYFARIDFTSQLDKNKIVLYIGKVGVMSENGDMIVTDWRAPISSIYYDGNLGDLSYKVDEDLIYGTLELKRQIIIEKSQLINVFDVDSVSDDELLKPYLGAGADNRLKNIVASIQSEQNDIIRADINKNIIVQGVAGSGKTTVALHRIAYLVYNYSKKVNANQFMVIGPNKFFINYISTVLPDLDVGNAVQCTYEELSIEYIKEKFDIEEPTQKLIEYIYGKEIEKYSRIKTSMKYKEAIDKFLFDYEESIMPKEDFKICNCTIYTKEEVIDMYKLHVDLPNISSRVDITVKLLSNKLKLDTSKHAIIKQEFDIMNSKEASTIKWKIIKNIENGCIAELRKYLSLNNIKVLQLYKMFIQNSSKYIEFLDSDFVITTMSNIQKKLVQFEDIPAMIYIKTILYGINDYNKYVHVVIDESQDFGAFNFYVLTKLMPNSTFSIFGDITQGIYSYRGIYDWYEVKKESFNNKCEIMRLEKSYRTTIEIMQTANKISKHLNLGECKPVIRHGNDVRITKCNIEEKIRYIANLIRNSIDMGYKSIAIICKTPNESKNIYEKLKSFDFKLEYIMDDNELYNGGICILTSYLSKGLEFDCVIITDADESIYSSKNEMDMKLMYVACTRALHNLEIIYNNEIIYPFK
ncbi:MAG: 3'-5' exonuclease [Clostridia bacterium]|nr:3'-5' exonuclease [Clostridia bacterium]MDD4386920.1 3'-5' exonuclease [Clostridia bacterium]